MKKNKGYTLVELLIAVTVAGLLTTMGLSAYSVARQRQEIRGFGEIIEVALREAQKNAQVGNANCLGTFIGYSVTVDAVSDAIVISPTCTQFSLGSEIVQATDLDIITNTTIIFYQNGGMNITTPTDIDFQSANSGIRHRITVTPPGSITYIGEP